MWKYWSILESTCCDCDFFFYWICLLTSPPCGRVLQINRLLIGHTNEGLQAGWFLDSVLIWVPVHGLQYMFPSHRWLCKDEADGKVEVEIYPSEIQDIEKCTRTHPPTQVILLIMVYQNNMICTSEIVTVLPLYYNDRISVPTWFTTFEWAECTIPCQVGITPNPEDKILSKILLPN